MRWRFLASVVACVACARDLPVQKPMPAAGPSSAAPSAATTPMTPDAAEPVSAVDAAGPSNAPALTITTLADVTKSSFGVAVDDAYVYLAIYEGGDVIRVPRNGGAPVVIASGQDFTNAIACDDSGDVYWSIGPGRTPGGAIRRLAKGTSTPVDFAPAQADARSVAVDATDVYWIVAGGYDGMGGTSKPEIRRRSKKGGKIETLAAVPDGPTRLVLDGDAVFFVAMGSPPYSSQGVVAKVAKRGGAVSVLASGQNDPRGLAVDGASVYWSIVGPMVVPPPRACPVNAPCPIPSATPIAAQGELRRVPRAGGPTTVLLRALRGAGPVAAHAGVVLFVADQQTQVVLGTGGAPRAIAPSEMSEAVFKDGTAYAQLGGRVVAIR